MNLDETIENEINKLINKKDKKYNYKVLVLSGGGTRGLSYIGGFKVLEEFGILENIHTFAATSIGTLVIALYLIGYSPDEMKDFLYLFDTNKMTTIDGIKDISLHGLIKNYGVAGNYQVHQIFHKLLKGKGLKENITLLELFKITNKKFILTTVCINTKEVEYLSYETYPNLRLTDALIMSTAVPFYFTPLNINNKYYVDGGMIDNFPINLFEKNLNEVLGFYMDYNYPYVEIKNFYDYLSSIIILLTKGYIYNMLRFTKNNTIKIIVNLDNPLKFNLTKEEKTDLYTCGYNCVKQFFNYSSLSDSNSINRL